MLLWEIISNGVLDGIQLGLGWTKSRIERDLKKDGYTGKAFILETITEISKELDSEEEGEEK